MNKFLVLFLFLLSFLRNAFATWHFFPMESRALLSIDADCGNTLLTKLTNQRRHQQFLHFLVLFLLFLSSQPRIVASFDSIKFTRLKFFSSSEFQLYVFPHQRLSSPSSHTNEAETYNIGGKALFLSVFFFRGAFLPFEDSFTHKKRAYSPPIEQNENGKKVKRIKISTQIIDENKQSKRERGKTGAFSIAVLVDFPSLGVALCVICKFHSVHDAHIHFFFAFAFAAFFFGWETTFSCLGPSAKSFGACRTARRLTQSIHSIHYNRKECRGDDGREKERMKNMT